MLTMSVDHHAPGNQNSSQSSLEVKVREIFFGGVALAAITMVRSWNSLLGKGITPSSPTNRRFGADYFDEVTTVIEGGSSSPKVQTGSSKKE